MNVGIVHHGARNPAWKGGRSVTQAGYVLIRVGKDHPLADVRGYAYEHRLKAYEAGRLEANDRRIVHHDNEVKADNSPTNLEPLTHAQHGVAHRRLERGLRLPDEPNPIVACTCGCGATFSRYDGQGRPRRFMPGHNNMGTRKRRQ